MNIDIEKEELTPFQIALYISDHERRLKEQEDDMKVIKPLVYDTAGAVKQIEKSVSKMEKNSTTIRNYFLGAIITSGIGIIAALVLLAIKSQ